MCVWCMHICKQSGAQRQTVSVCICVCACVSVCLYPAARGAQRQSMGYAPCQQVGLPSPSLSLSLSLSLTQTHAHTPSFPPPLFLSFSLSLSLSASTVSFYRAHAHKPSILDHCLCPSLQLHLDANPVYACLLCPCLREQRSNSMYDDVT